MSDGNHEEPCEKYREWKGQEPLCGKCAWTPEYHPDQHRELQAQLSRLREALEKKDADKDEAYLQRNNLVAALARIYPSGIMRTNIPGWSEDWHGCCFIDLPSGQISYHYHDSHAYLFDGLPPYKKVWDGHDKETVHKRLAALATLKESPNE